MEDKSQRNSEQVASPSGPLGTQEHFGLGSLFKTSKAVGLDRSNSVFPRVRGECVSMLATVAALIVVTVAARGPCKPTINCKLIGNEVKYVRG
jgi:hypothetical protein